MLFSRKTENLKLASRSRDYMRKSTIENLKTCQPREQNMQLSFDKRCLFPAQNSAFSLGPTRLMSGKLSRLKSKHTRKNRHASGLNENGSKFDDVLRGRGFFYILGGVHLLISRIALQFCFQPFLFKGHSILYPHPPYGRGQSKFTPKKSKIKSADTCTPSEIA